MDKKQILEIIKNNQVVLTSKFGLERIGLFGSYAREEQYENSDVDLAVEISKADLFNFIALKNYLQDILKKNVDIVRYRDTMNESLKRRILRDIIYV
ncbi:MAG: nucleotidyltransferase domain-containing protein [Melioribacteraceae bacterium]